MKVQVKMVSYHSSPEGIYKHIFHFQMVMKRYIEIILYFLGCTMYDLGGLAINEGKTVDYYGNQTAEECKKLCAVTENCNSVSHDTVYLHCYLKDKIFNGTEPQKESRYGTYYKICEGIFAIL